MRGQQGLRGHSRVLFEAQARVSWMDQSGATCYALCRCVDIAETGMRLESKEPIPPYTMVHFQIESPIFSGASMVRWCRRTRMRYHLGLTFAGVKWCRPLKGRPQPVPIT